MHELNHILIIAIISRTIKTDDHTKLAKVINQTYGLLQEIFEH